MALNLSHFGFFFEIFLAGFVRPAIFKKLDRDKYTTLEIPIIGGKLVIAINARKKSGTIINMSSMGGKVYTLLGSWYYATDS